MLEKLLFYFKNHDLPYYWVSGFNLLSILRPEEITNYANILRSSYGELRKISDKNVVPYFEVEKHFKVNEN